MLKYLLSPPAVKNQATGNFILNAKGKEARSHVFIEMGLEWEYTIEHGKENLKTSGPLHDAISILVSLADASSGEFRDDHLPAVQRRGGGPRWDVRGNGKILAAKGHRACH